MNYPKISIVTPSYNQGQYLEETITSILNQQYPNLEYIIIDGGSTDNSVEIIKKYDKHLKYWVSEKDGGQANAINKGLVFCDGDIFNWINSDDYLEPQSLFKIAEAFSDTRVQLVAGSVRNFSTTMQEVVPNQLLSANGLMCWSPGVKFIQPGVWMRRSLIEACGGIDEKFHYAFDWDLYIRYLYHFSEVKEISDLLVHFRLHDDSKTQSLRTRFADEERKIIQKIARLQAFTKLHKTCLYKIQKAEWTKYLANLSNSSDCFIIKLFKVLARVISYYKVSFSRQTLGALRAYWNKKIIYTN